MQSPSSIAANSAAPASSTQLPVMTPTESATEPSFVEGGAVITIAGIE
jgi:hypothetical protein